jgi:hypothetical protein
VISLQILPNRQQGMPREASRGLGRLARRICSEYLHFVGLAISNCLLPSSPRRSVTADSSAALRATAPVRSLVLTSTRPTVIFAHVDDGACFGPPGLGQQATQVVLKLFPGQDQGKLELYSEWQLFVIHTRVQLLSAKRSLFWTRSTIWVCPCSPGSKRQCLRRLD